MMRGLVVLMLLGLAGAGCRHGPASPAPASPRVQKEAVPELESRPMDGPLASLGDACQQEQEECASLAEEEQEKGEFSCSTGEPLARIAPPAAPFKEAMVFRAMCQHSGIRAEISYHLAVRVNLGWYHIVLASAMDRSRHDHSFDVEELRLWRTGAGRPPAIVVRTDFTDIYRGLNNGSRTALQLLAIGPAGVPWTTDSLVIRMSGHDYSEDDDTMTAKPKERPEQSLEVRFLEGAQLLLSGPPPDPADDREEPGTTLSRLRGRYRLFMAGN